MSISRKSRTLLHVGRRAPHLYRSARRAGAGRGEALEVVAASAGAFTQAAARENGERGRQNAMRHFIWQAYLAARLGQTVARRVADAYEQGSPDPADSRVDERNNAVAWEYAAAHHDAIADVDRARSTTPSPTWTGPGPSPGWPRPLGRSGRPAGSRPSAEHLGGRGEARVHLAERRRQR